MQQILFKKDPPHPLLIDLPCVVAFYNDCSFVGPHHRGVAERFRVVVHNITIKEGLFKHLAGGKRDFRNGKLLFATAAFCNYSSKIKLKMIDDKSRFYRLPCAYHTRGATSMQFSFENQHLRNRVFC